MRAPSHRSKQHGYTLPEVAVSAGLLLLVLLLLVGAIHTALTLYTKNYSINESHSRARNLIEKIAMRVHAAVEPPQLVDNAGATVAGNGPAAGITCLSYAGNKPYYTSNAINLNTKTIQVNQIADDQPMPQTGDYVLMPQVKENAYQYAGNGSFYGEITLAEPSGQRNVKLTFANNIGTYFDPPPTGLTVINPDQPFFILSRSAFIAVNAGGRHVLRYYPRAMSVAANGQDAFDHPSNFRIIAELNPPSGQTACLPFRYLDPQRRRVDVDARTISRRYDARMKRMNTFIDPIHTAIAYRSAIQKTLQPQ